MMRLVFACLCLATAVAADPVRLAEEAAADMAAAAEALSGDGDRVAALTAALEAYQAGQATLREALRQAEAAERRIAADLAQGDVALSRTAALLVRLQLQPRAALTLHPGGPLAAMRAGRLASEVVERTGAETARLAGMRDSLRDAQALHADLLVRFETASRDIRATRRDLLTETAARAPDVGATDISVLTALLDAADSLSGLAAAFAETPRTALGLRDLPLPVPGPATPDGAGLSVAAEPGAVVRAPAQATVRYAGPAPGTGGGTALLIEPAQGHLLILAGRADPLVAPGQIVAAGDPIALMRPSVAPDSAGDDPTVNESETGTGQPTPERLYIEWQEGGAPVDISGRFRLP